MTHYQLIRKAIVEKKIVEAVYDGRLRIMCPHVIGQNKQGRDQVLCYQFGGESSSRPIEGDGSPNNWRCCVIDKFEKVQLTDGP